MKNPVNMTKWIASRTVTKDQYEKLPEEEREHKYPVGILRENTTRYEYSELYHKHIIPAAKEAAKKEAAAKNNKK